MKKTLRAVLISLLLIFASLAVVYILLGRYYSTGFPCYTWINGIYCTGKSVEQVNAELLEKDVYPGITVYGREDESIFISASEVGFSQDYSDCLNSFLKSQNPYAWGLNLFKNIYASFEPTVSVDVSKFMPVILSWEIFSEEKEAEVTIEKTDDGYVLVNGLQGIPDKEHIMNVVYDAMLNKQLVIDLTNYSFAYADMPLSGDDERTAELFEKIQNVQDCKITYVFGNEIIPMDASVVSEFILTADDLEEAKEEVYSKKQPWLGKFIVGRREIELPENIIDLSVAEAEVLEEFIEENIYDDDTDESSLESSSEDSAIVEESTVLVSSSGSDYDNKDSSESAAHESEVTDSTYDLASSYDTLYIWQGFVVDEKMNIIISESKMHKYFEELGEKYDTEYLMELYRKGEASEIAINSNKGNGSLFDVDSVYEEFKNAYLYETYHEEKEITLAMEDTITTYDAYAFLGSTYIEVNMNKQMLYYYVDGELSMDMPIVTGNINRSRGTPTGIYNVYNKRYHTYLRGADYVSYVNYWLGVNKGVGIHDANWRSEFGGEIYKSDGSHGCINCPEDQVSVLWEVVEVGTPVVLYY